MWINFKIRRLCYRKRYRIYIELISSDEKEKMGFKKCYAIRTNKTKR